MRDVRVHDGLRAGRSGSVGRAPGHSRTRRWNAWDRRAQGLVPWDASSGRSGSGVPTKKAHTGLSGDREIVHICGGFSVSAVQLGQNRRAIVHGVLLRSVSQERTASYGASQVVSNIFFEGY